MGHLGGWLLGGALKKYLSPGSTLDQLTQTLWGLGTWGVFVVVVLFCFSLSSSPDDP